MSSSLSSVSPNVTANDKLVTPEDKVVLEGVLRDIRKCTGSVVEYQYEFKESVKTDLQRRGFYVITNDNAGLSEHECTASDGAFCRGCCRWTKITWDYPTP